MRETSSRSSTSRTRCPICRSMMVRSLAAVGAAQPHQLQRRQDRRERVAQLVPQHGQELVLRPVGRLGQRPRPFGLDGRLPQLARLLLDLARRARPLEVNTDARHQLARRERLDQVVVGAGLQPSTRASSPARAESRMTGMSAGFADRPRSARSRPNPSRFGIITSVSIRSGRAARGRGQRGGAVGRPPRRASAGASSRTR